MKELDRIQMDIDSGMQELMSRIHEYEGALKFYARHEHWMEVAEGAEARTLFVAGHGDSTLSMDGYSVAEHVLSKYEVKP